MFIDKDFFRAVIVPGSLPGNDNFVAPKKDKPFISSDHVLCDAIMQNDAPMFKLTIALKHHTRNGLNKALFLATAFERDDFRASLLRHGAHLSEIANGMLLRHILKGEIDGVRFSLRKPDIDVGAHDEECFKQAVLANRFDIVDLLHGSGSDMTTVLSDDVFMDKVNRQNGVTREMKKEVYRLTGEFDFGPYSDFELSPL